MHKAILLAASSQVTASSGGLTAQSVAIIVAVITLASGTIAAAINYALQMRLKKLELKQEAYKNQELHVRKIFEEYLSAVGVLLTSNCEGTPQQMQKYNQFYLLSLFYAPGEAVEKIQLIDAKIRLAGKGASQLDLTELFSDLALLLKRASCNGAP